MKPTANRTTFLSAENVLISLNNRVLRHRCKGSSFSGLLKQFVTSGGTIQDGNYEFLDQNTC